MGKACRGSIWRGTLGFLGSTPFPSVCLSVCLCVSSSDDDSIVDHGRPICTEGTDAGSKSERVGGEGDDGLW